METRWAAQSSLPDIRHTLPPLRRVKGLEGAEVIARRPLTDSKRLYKDGSTHTKRTSTDRAPGKAPAQSRAWRLALPGEANKNDKGWQGFDIDIQEDSPITHVSYDPLKNFQY